MANEPRKPKFTNRKKLMMTMEVLWCLSLTVMFGTFFWVPSLVIGLGILMLAYIPQGALNRLNKWERAQWRSERSYIDSVDPDFYYLLQKAEADNLVGWVGLAEVRLLNGDIVEVSTSIWPSKWVTYEVREVDGVREFRNGELAK